MLDAAKTEGVTFTDIQLRPCRALHGEMCDPNGAGAKTKTGCRAIIIDPSGPER